MSAEKRGAAHIPHFLEFERCGMNASIVLEVLPERLRDAIGNRSFMEMNGCHIIKNLLEGMLELRKYRLVLKDINPSNIAISADHKRL